MRTGSQFRIANINLSHRFLTEGNIEQEKKLLLNALPKDGEEDIRGFEWRYLWTEYAKDQPIIFEGHKELVQDVAFSPDTSFMASSDEEGFIILWDVVQRIDIARWKGHRGWVTSLSFSHDGKFLAAMGRAETRGISEGQRRL